jgi:hypothetical protein
MPDAESYPRLMGASALVVTNVVRQVDDRHATCAEFALDAVAIGERGRTRQVSATGIHVVSASSQGSRSWRLPERTETMGAHCPRIEGRVRVVGCLSCSPAPAHPA